MLHVVMVLLVWFVVGLFLYDFDCVFGVWCVVGGGCVWCVVGGGCVWCVVFGVWGELWGDVGLKVPSKN
jgi:hypothetical protein